MGYKSYSGVVSLLMRDKLFIVFKVPPLLPATEVNDTAFNTRK